MVDSCSKNEECSSVGSDVGDCRRLAAMARIAAVGAY